MRDFFFSFTLYMRSSWERQFIWNHSIKVNAQKCAKFWKKNWISKKEKKQIRNPKKCAKVSCDWLMTPFCIIIIIIIKSIAQRRRGPLDGLHLFWQWRMFSHEQLQNENAVEFNEKKSFFFFSSFHLFSKFREMVSC